MKRANCWLICIILLIFTTGCNSESSSDKFAKSFVNEYYTVQDYTKYVDQSASTDSYSNYSESLRKMLSQKAIEKDILNRSHIGIINSSVSNKFNIKVDEVNVKLTKDKNDATMLYDYSANLHLQFQDKVQTKKVSGQFTVKKEKESWIIDTLNKVDISFIIPFN